jgi:hypothetical protein
VSSEAWAAFLAVVWGVLKLQLSGALVGWMLRGAVDARRRRKEAV